MHEFNNSQAKIEGDMQDTSFWHLAAMATSERDLPEIHAANPPNKVWYRSHHRLQKYHYLNMLTIDVETTIISASLEHSAQVS